MTVIQLSGGDRLVWSHHHALLDGWSATALPRGGRRPIDRAGAGSAVRRLPGLAGRSRAGSRSRVLDQPVRRPAGCLGAADARCRRRPAAGPGFALSLPDNERRALADRARSLRVGVATLAHAAWALVLAEYLRSEDVTFGVTASGRPAELSGADRMIGLFITTHPARVRLPSATPLAAWAAELATQEATNRQHAHAGLVAIGRGPG